MESVCCAYFVSHTHTHTHYTLHIRRTWAMYCSYVTTYLTAVYCLLPLVFKANELSERVGVSFCRATTDTYCHHSRLRLASRTATFHFPAFWPPFISIISLMSVIIVFQSSHCVITYVESPMNHRCLPASHMIIDGTSTPSLWFPIPKMFSTVCIGMY
jgi:hypothetical protein